MASHNLLHHLHHLRIPSHDVEDCASAYLGIFHRPFLGAYRNAPINHPIMGRRDGLSILPRGERGRFWTRYTLPLVIFLLASRAGLSDRHIPISSPVGDDVRWCSGLWYHFWTLEIGQLATSVPGRGSTDYPHGPCSIFLPAGQSRQSKISERGGEANSQSQRRETGWRHKEDWWSCVEGRRCSAARPKVLVHCCKPQDVNESVVDIDQVPAYVLQLQRQLLLASCLPADDPE